MPASPAEIAALGAPSWAARLWRWLLGRRGAPLALRPPPLRPPATPRSAQRVAPPWAAAQPALSLEPGALRAGLLRALLAEQEAAPIGPDREFAARLFQLVADEQLELPVFPAVAQELHALLRGGQPAAAAVARLVSQEPELLRRVWTAAGRGPFARRPASLDHALTRMGLDGLWRVLMEASLLSPVLHVGRMQAPAERARSRALIAAEVAGWLLDEPRGDAWMAGLLHGVGRLVLYRYAGAGRGPAPSFGRVEAIAERLHPSVSALVVQAWGLSPAVALGVGAYPAPDWQVGPPQALARAVRAGVVAGWSMELGRQGIDCGGEAELASLSGGLWSPAEALSRARRADPALRASA